MPNTPNRPKFSLRLPALRHIHFTIHIFLLCLCGQSKILKGEFADGGRVRAWSYARTQRELLLCNGLMCMVSWSCGHACGFVCGGAALLSRATQRCVELCGHDSAIQGCIARSASWPSINLAGLICDWISMPPSNVAMVIRSRYQRRRRIENFGPAPPPPAPNRSF